MILDDTDYSDAAVLEALHVETELPITTLTGTAVDDS